MSGQLTVIGFYTKWGGAAFQRCDKASSCLQALAAEVRVKAFQRLEICICRILPQVYQCGRFS
jgi:hypothetical protein